MGNTGNADRRFRRHRLYLGVVTATLLGAGFASSAEAATFTVNTLLDTSDASPGDGSALDSQGRTSLRAAIEEANALTGAHSIQFAASLVTNGDATISLSLFDSGQDAGELGPTAFIIGNNTSLSIDGPSGDNGITIERSAAAASFRFFHVR